MNSFNPKLEFSRIVSFVKEFTWKEQPWQVKTGLIFGGCTAFLILRRVFMSVEAKINKRPPQLYGLPIIGSLLTMEIWSHKFFRNMLPKYGDIVMYNYGSERVYAINDMQLLNCVFRKAISRLPFDGKMFTSYGHEIPVVFATKDDNWGIRRKIAMASITKVMNKKELEERISVILQEITYKELNSLFVDNGSGSSGSTGSSNKKYAIWYPRKCLRNAVFNVIYFATFGKSSMIDDKIYQDYNESVKGFIGYALDAFLALTFGSFLTNVLGYAGGQRKFVSSLDTLFKLTEKEFEEVIKDIESSQDSLKEEEEKEFEAKTIAQCIYQTFILDKKNIGNDGKMDKTIYDRCVSDAVALLLAGMDTTGHSTEVGVLLLAKYPQIQEKLFNELSGVFKVTEATDQQNEVSNNSNNSKYQFTFGKMQECVLFRAFVNEALRIACAVPNGVTRAADKELRCIKWTKNNGQTFDIICQESGGRGGNKKYDFNKILKNKKNQIVYDYIIEPFKSIEGNFAYLCLENKNSWNKDIDPMKLDLNYWLKKNEKSGKISFKNNLNSMPFSVGGSRDCLGQSLARKELIAFLANLILNYQIEAQNGDSKSVNIQYKMGATFVVEPQIPVRIYKRY